MFELLAEFIYLLKYFRRKWLEEIVFEIINSIPSTLNYS